MTALAKSLTRGFPLPRLPSVYTLFYICFSTGEKNEMYFKTVTDVVSALFYK